jgi:RHS repeat-associated protein
VLRFVSGTSRAVRYQREFTIKDHLGNLRLAYRLGQVRRITATLEQDEDTHKRETQQFDSPSVSPPVAVATGLARSGGWAAKLNAGGDTPQPIGPLTQLGVQKGDTVTVTAYGHYPQAQQHGFLFSLATFITNLLHPASPPPIGLEVGKRKNLPLLQVGLSAGLASLPQLSGGVPQAYLRLLVFDKDSVLLKDQCQVVQLTEAASAGVDKGYEELRLRAVLPQDGYVTAYVGSQSDVDVYFDDVTVEHRQGLQVQEIQYEPWGMGLNGINYISPNTSQSNDYQFNGKEKVKDLNLLVYDFQARVYDPTLGKSLQLDPHSENYYSTSAYSWLGNNPLLYIDPTGMDLVYAKYKDLSEEDKSKYTKKEYNLMRREGMAAMREGERTSPVYKSMLKDLRNSENIHTVIFNKNENSSQDTDEQTGNSTISVSVVQKLDGLEDVSQKTNTMVVAGHEVGHAWRNEYGLDPLKIKVDVTNFVVNTFLYQNEQRKRIIEPNAVRIENMVRSEANLPLREYYFQNAEGGAWYNLYRESVRYISPYDIHKIYNVKPIK